MRSLGRVDEVTLVDQSADASGNAEGVVHRKVEKPPYLPESTGLTSLTILAPRVRFAGSLVESVHLSDAEKLLAAVEKAAGVVTSTQFVGAALRGRPSDNSGNSRQHDGRPRSAAPTKRQQDLFSDTSNLLKTLADIPAVSGHEREVREAIKAALPGWAGSLARTDTEGNLILELGPDRDATMAEPQRIVNLAQWQRIPLQVGATNGGTDGSSFIGYGALHVGLS